MEWWSLNTDWKRSERSRRGQRYGGAEENLEICLRIDDIHTEILQRDLRTRSSSSGSLTLRLVNNWLTSRCNSCFFSSTRAHLHCWECRPVMQAKVTRACHVQEKDIFTNRLFTKLKQLLYCAWDIDIHTSCVFVRASLHMRREEKPTRCHWMVYCTYAQHVSGNSMPTIRSSRLYVCYYCLWCAMPWLLVFGGQVQGSRLPCTWPPTTSNQSIPHHRR